MLAKTAWDTLSAIDVNKHTDTKGKFSYLAWTWAWATLMEKFPASNYEFKEPVVMPDSTVEIQCALTVSDGKESITRTMWLPVLNHQNKPIPGPTAFDINTTKMRCLVKAMAMFGLGHYIYAGESIPENAPKYTEAQYDAFYEAFNERKAVDLYLFRLTHESAYIELTNSFEAGKKTANKKQLAALEAEGCEAVNGWAQDIENYAAGQDLDGITEIMGDLDEQEKRVVWSRVTPATKALITELKKEAA